MCRVALYMGRPITIEKILFLPSNSLVKQSYRPKYMPQLHNLAGFGMAIWDRDSYKPEIPFIYKTTELPFFDGNLKRMSEKFLATTFLAHIRGVNYSDKEMIAKENEHPFRFANTNLILAHNGGLFGFSEIKNNIKKYIKKEMQRQIAGNTDSEVIYALLLSQLHKVDYDLSLKEVKEALLKTIHILRKIYSSLKIKASSPLNLFISNGSFLIATRYVLNYGFQSPHFFKPRDYLSLWYTFGKTYKKIKNDYYMSNEVEGEGGSIIFASEPLSDDSRSWLSVPEYSLATAKMSYIKKTCRIECNIEDID